ncbi:MAG: hypothetical protein ACT4P3_20980 [Betaproteobacteria bacterium]
MTRRLIALLRGLSPAACAVLFLVVSSPSFAEGPGTRIRSSTQLPQPPQSLPRDAADPCARLTDAARERCLEKARKPAPTGTARRGPSGASAPR